MRGSFANIALRSFDINISSRRFRPATTRSASDNNLEARDSAFLPTPALPKRPQAATHGCQDSHSHSHSHSQDKHSQDSHSQDKHCQNSQDSYNQHKHSQYSQSQDSQNSQNSQNSCNQHSQNSHNSQNSCDQLKHSQYSHSQDSQNSQSSQNSCSQHKHSQDEHSQDSCSQLKHSQNSQDSCSQDRCEGEEDSGWGTIIPLELVAEVMRRIEESEREWPSRRSIVACAGVCKMWRSVTKDIVQNLPLSGRLTFPISLKQSAPLEATIQCFIKRDRATSTFTLYLGLTPTLSENGKFLMSARKVRRATSTEYIISLNANVFGAQSTCIGKLRSNFLGTKFTIYDNQPSTPNGLLLTSMSWAGRPIASKQVFPRVPIGSYYTVGHIAYELNVLGARGPRRMHCALNSCFKLLPPLLETLCEPPPTNTVSDSMGSSRSLLRSRASPNPTHLQPEGVPRDEKCEEVLILKNKAPRWHEQLQCWCLNFRGRVTVASVKNFQLVASALDLNSKLPPSPSHIVDHDKVLLQFGKIGKDTFTMDYRYPLSAFQAFAIALSSFDTKLACE